MESLVNLSYFLIFRFIIELSPILKNILKIRCSPVVAIGVFVLKHLVNEGRISTSTKEGEGKRYFYF